MGNQGDSSGELARASARAYVRASRALQGGGNPSAAPAFGFAEVRSERSAAFARAELPDVPFGSIALTPQEKQARMMQTRAQLAESTSKMRQLVSYQRKLAEESRSVGQAVGMTVVAASIIFLAFALAYLSHLGADGLLNP
nr:hypothetical protein [Corynebacterium lactis]